MVTKVKIEKEIYKKVLSEVDAYKCDICGEIITNLNCAENHEARHSCTHENKKYYFSDDSVFDTDFNIYKNTSHLIIEKICNDCGMPLGDIKVSLEVLEEKGII